MKTAIKIIPVSEDRQFTHQEKIDHRSWKKGSLAPADDKHSVYVNSVWACFVEGPVTVREAKKIKAVQETMAHVAA